MTNVILLVVLSKKKERGKTLTRHSKLFLHIFRYHVFYDVDSSREEMIKNENDFEAKSEELLDKSKTMLNR